MDGITAAVGLNGSGKTLAMMSRVIVPSLKLGRPILSNTPIFRSGADADLDWWEREPHPLYVPLVSWRQLDNRLHGCTIFFDEISSLFDSRESRSMPGQVVNLLQQMRKEDNVVGWTAPRWERCDSAIRGVTQTVYLCSGHRWRTVNGSAWKSATKFRWRYFDAEEFDEFSLARARSDQEHVRLRPRWRMTYRIGRGSDRAWDYYATKAPVHRLDHLDTSGVCIGCGGTRSRHRCSCGAGATVGHIGRPRTLSELRAHARECIAAREDAGQYVAHSVPVPESLPDHLEPVHEDPEHYGPDLLEDLAEAQSEEVDTHL